MRKFFTTFGLFLITTLSFAQETKYVDTELLNVRSGAGTKYEVIDKISQGEKVIAYSTQGTWTEIELNNGTRGYVSTKFLGGVQYVDGMNIEVAVSGLGAGGSPFNNIVEKLFVQEFARKYNVEPRFHSSIKSLFKRDRLDVDIL